MHRIFSKFKKKGKRRSNEIEKQLDRTYVEKCNLRRGSDRGSARHGEEEDEDEEEESTRRGLSLSLYRFLKVEMVSSLPPPSCVF